MNTKAPINTYEQRTQTPGVPGAPRASAPALGGFAHQGFEALSQGTERLSLALQEREDEDARAWASKALSQARLEWTRHFIDRQAQAEPGAPDFTPKLLDDYDKYAEGTIEAAPSAKAKRYLNERMADFRANLGISATQFEAQARIDHRTDQFTDAIRNTQKLMNTDPAQYQVAMAERLAEIDSSNIPPIKKSALREKAINDVSSSAVWAQIQKSPDQFLQSIGFYESADHRAKGERTRKTAGDLTGATGNMAFDALPFERRVALFESAIKTKAQIEADADRAAAARSGSLGADAMKEGWKRLYDGNLTAAYVEEIRPLLKPAEYHSLREGLAKGAVVDDPKVFQELQNLIYKKPSEAYSFALRMHANKQISNDTLAVSLSRIDGVSREWRAEDRARRSEGRQEGPKSEYERGTAYIVRSLDPGPLVQDPVQKSRLAEAMDTFDGWMKSGKRTDKEINDRAKEIVGQYRFIDLTQSVMALPSPRSGAIRRNPSDVPGIRMDLKAAAESAQRKLADKTFTQAEYEQEMGILNRWRKITEQPQ